MSSSLVQIYLILYVLSFETTPASRFGAECDSGLEGFVLP